MQKKERFLRMKSRHRKRMLALLLTGSMLTGVLPHQTSSQAHAAERAADSVQTVEDQAEGAIRFNDDWKFYLATRTPEVNGNFAAGGVKDAGDYTTAQIIAETFDDASWQTVDIPHDFSIEGEKVAASQDSQGYLQGGLGWYRKKFIIPASMQGAKTISIDFDGVYQNSVVYLNGEEIGAYPNGYTGFALDITNKLKYGKENVLVVKVQNMSPSGRWYTGSGITRPVHLTIDNLAHFNRNGIALRTPTLKEDYETSKKAYLEVVADCYSDASNSNAYLKVSVFDAQGTKVGEKETEKIAINPSTAFSASLSGRNAIEIPDVRLWHPWNLGEPYLYTVKAELYTEVNGSSDGYQLRDTEEFEYGFRWMEIAESTADPDSGGLYVNGKYTKIQGVDLHHDSGALGAASYADAFNRQFNKLIEMGVNAYRTSHCPPSREAIEACRRKGILVIEEAYDGWGAAKAQYDFGNFFFMEVPQGWAGLKPNGYTTLPEPATSYNGARYLWSDWVVQEMVNRDKNEPSIIAWSIGNEVRGVGTKPDWYDPSQYDVLNVRPSNINFYTEAVRLSRNIKAIDDTRFILMGGDQERAVPGADSDWGLVNQVLDGYGLNYNTAKSVDGLIDRFSVGDGTLKENGSKTFFFESESSSQTSSRGVYLDPQFSNTGINQTPGKRGGSNYDNDFASWTMSNEYGLKKDRDRKRFVGQFIWTGFDYLGEPTPYSIFPVGVSSFGTIDTAGFPKDSFYLYQSQWTSEPMAHLVPQNWDFWHKGETVEVWVNTNQQDAELFLNGTSLGKKSFDQKTTAYGKTYYETSEKTQDDKTWGDNSNPGGYTSPGADAGDGLNSGRLHLKWDVPYEPGVLEVKAYGKDGSVTATDRVVTSSAPYTIRAQADKTVLAADGSSLSYVECTVVDEEGNMVPDANHRIRFSIDGAAEIAGVDNGQQESTELYKYGNTQTSNVAERTAYNGKALVIVKSKKEAGSAVLTISSDTLNPVRLTLSVTDGSSDAVTEHAKPVLVSGTERSAEPVRVTVPTGMDVTLPSYVKVKYDSDAGEYALLRKVTWKAAANGKAEGTIKGSALTAAAEITEDASLSGELDQTEGAFATASFTGSTQNYPENMLDGNAPSSWTNAYVRPASVLLPENRASRKSDYVEFYWQTPRVINKIALSFQEGRGCALPSVLEAQYWNGADWTTANGQIAQTDANGPSTLEFAPVYTDRVRVYMENKTPYTENGNIEITEASLLLNADSSIIGAQLLADSAQAGRPVTATLRLSRLPADPKLKEIRFGLEYDDTAFEHPSAVLADGVRGSLTADGDGYVYANAEGLSEDTSDFIKFTLETKTNVRSGEYPIAITDITAKDLSDNTLPLGSARAEVSITGSVTTDKTALANALASIRSLQEDQFTEESWQTLQQAVQNAQNVMENASALPEEAEEALARLTAAIDRLAVPYPKHQDTQDQLQNTKNELEQAKADLIAAEKLKQELEQIKAELEKWKSQSASSLNNGDAATASGVKYRVTDAASKTAEAYGAEGQTAKTLSVADTVSIGGVTCTVTAIANAAFANMKKLTKVTIGKNVEKIGKKAFWGDKALKTITIQSETLASAGGQAFKGISSKAIIRVPKSKKKAYQKLLKGKGQKNSVKIK